MQKQVFLISIVVGVAIFLIILAISTLIYQSNIKNTRYYKEHPDDWFFYKFSDKVFNALFGITEPEDVAIKLGIDVEEYYKNCMVVGVEANIRGIVTDYIYGFLTLFFFIIIAIFVNPLFFMFGLSSTYIFIKRKRITVKSKAESMREQIKGEFPRFLGLLSTELEVGLPIDTAIYLLSHKYDSLISKEFLTSFNDMRLGAVGWQGALYQISTKYSIDDFSDFVMDVTTAFSKGTSISEAVKERTREIKTRRLYDVKEKAAKTESIILIPIAICQFIPMVAFILLPTIQSVVNI